MAGSTNEVQASMYSHIKLVTSVRLLFLSHKALVLIIDKVDNGSPRVFIVDIVAKARCINNIKFHSELLLLKFSFDDIDFSILVFDLFAVAIRIVAPLSEFSCEQSIDECSFSQTRLSYDHYSEMCTSLGYYLVLLIGKVCVDGLFDEDKAASWTKLPHGSQYSRCLGSRCSGQHTGTAIVK
jgi:hypothetical protein